MRFAGGLAAAFALLVCGCKGDRAAGAASAPARVSPGARSGSALAADVPERRGAAGLDCNKLLGVTRAQAALLQPVIAEPPAGAGRCRYRAVDPGASATPPAFIDVVVACGEAAAPLARAVLSRTAAGFPTADVGQRAVIVESKAQGVVQFVERDAPCAAEVTAVPADRVVAVAREVARGLAEGGRP